MTVSLAELEARVSALEAERADYRAVLATVNVLSQQTRERLDGIDGKIDAVADRLDGKIEAGFAETNERVRSIEESVAEIKDLLIRALDK
jgi:hypothetical protein